MKTLILTIALVILNVTFNVAKAQTYTTESKSCGSCQKEVSIYSTIGMTCPHCGVTWGKENTHHTQKNYTNYNYNSYKSYDNSSNYYTSATTLSSCNLRSFQSTSANILDKIPAYTVLDIIEVNGNWVKVKYSYYDYTYGYVSVNGWIYRSLLSLS